MDSIESELLAKLVNVFGFNFKKNYPDLTKPEFLDVYKLLLRCYDDSWILNVNQADQKSFKQIQGYLKISELGHLIGRVTKFDELVDPKRNARLLGGLISKLESRHPGAKLQGVIRKIKLAKPNKTQTSKRVQRQDSSSSSAGEEEQRKEFQADESVVPAKGKEIPRTPPVGRKTDLKSEELFIKPAPVTSPRTRALNAAAKEMPGPSKRRRPDGKISPEAVCHEETETETEIETETDGDEEKSEDAGHHADSEASQKVPLTQKNRGKQFKKNTKTQHTQTQEIPLRGRWRDHMEEHHKSTISCSSSSGSERARREQLLAERDTRDPAAKHFDYLHFSKYLEENIVAGEALHDNRYFQQFIECCEHFDPHVALIQAFGAVASPQASSISHYLLKTFLERIDENRISRAFSKTIAVIVLQLFNSVDEAVGPCLENWVEYITLLAQFAKCAGEFERQLKKWLDDPSLCKPKKDALLQVKNKLSGKTEERIVEPKNVVNKEPIQFF